MAGSAHTWVDGDVATATYMNAIPYGIMGYVNGATANQSGILAITDITGLSVTFTAISTRLYRTTLVFNFDQLTSTGTVVGTIADGASAAVRTGVFSQEATFSGMMVVVALETGLTGSTTRKGRANTSAGTVTVRGTATERCSLIVEDLGPA